MPDPTLQDIEPLGAGLARALVIKARGVRLDEPPTFATKHLIPAEAK